MKHVLLGLAALAVCAGVGCATTTIRTPVGTYSSDRDSTLEGLEIEVIEIHADGTKKKTSIKVGKASGTASSVIDAQAALLSVGIQAGIELSKRAAGP